MKKTVKKTFYQTESVINKKVIAIFLVSFIVSLIVISGIFRLANKKTIAKIISKITKPRYNYFESKQPMIDPVMVKELIDSTEKDYLIVDIRSSMEYKWSHIKGAINMPAYEDPNNVYQTQNKLNDVYKKISKKFAGKKLVIIYGYRPDSDITEKVFEYLKKYKYPVRILSIPWYDWLHNFANWMPGIQTGGFDNSKYIEGNNNGILQPFVPPAPIAPIAPIPY